MNIEKVDLVLLQDEEDEVFYVEPAPYKEDPDELLIPLSEEEEVFTATSRVSLEQLFYDYMWWITGEDEAENHENIQEFKEQILVLIDAAYAKTVEDLPARIEKLKEIKQN